MPKTPLQQWACQQLNVAIDQTEYSLLAGDASFRSYYRLCANGQSWVLMDSPPDTEKNSEFIQISQYFEQAGLAAPKILAADKNNGWLLLSDLGDKTLQTQLSLGSVDQHYQQAMKLINQLQQLSVDEIPAYDAVLLQREMSLFQEWFVAGLLKHLCSQQESEQQSQVQNFIVEQVLLQPQVFVHRDFHSRNLMLLEGEENEQEQLAVIDYQDAVSGPMTYDLVSLLRDCYVCWPPEKVQQWLEAFYSSSAVAQQMSLNDFKTGFDLMGLQRHIKVLGIFSRLYLRDGKTTYLQDLPLVIHYTLSVASRYPQFLPWCEWFKSILLPLVMQQPWAKSYSLEQLSGEQSFKPCV